MWGGGGVRGFRALEGLTSCMKSILVGLGVLAMLVCVCLNIRHLEVPFGLPSTQGFPICFPKSCFFQRQTQKRAL